MDQKYFTVLLISITIGMVLSLGSPPAQAQQNNSKATIRVIILKNFPPQFVTTPDGPSGLAVEMMREVAQRASLKIEFVTLNSWKEVYEPLKNGSVDAIANMGISEARKKILEFIEPYEVFDIKIFVRKETNDIKTIFDIKGRLLGVQTTNVLTKGLVKSGDYQIKHYGSYKLALLGLLSGEVDAVPAPTEPFLLIARGARLDERIKFVGPSLLEVKRAIALPKGRTELRDLLNKSLREFKQTDDYQKLLTKWYGSDKPYWTATRLIMLMGVVLATSIFLMGLWRYYSVIRLNRRIQESDNQKKLIFQTVPELIWSKNSEGIYLACNAKFEHLYGATEAEIIGKTDYDFFDRDTADAILKQDKLVIEDKSLTYEKEVTFADDSHKEVMLMTKTPMKSVDGTVLGILGVGRNITERKRAEDALQKSERLLNQAQQIAHVGSYNHNIELGEIVWSDEQYRIFGYEPGEIDPTFDLVHEHIFPDDRRAFIDVNQSLVERNEPYDHEYRIVRKDGDVRTVRSISSLEFDATGKPVRQVGALQDITDRKLVEKELEKHREHLEVMIKERTAELEEKNKDLEQYNELFLNREFRIKELKDRIRELEAKESSKAERPE